MFAINLSSLLLILSVNKFLLGILMGYLWIKIPDIDGIKEWAWGSVLTAIGLFIFAIYPYPAPTFTDFAYSLSLNLFIMSGDLLFFLGFLKFKKQAANKYLFIIIPFLLIVSTTVFTLIFKILWLRVLINMGLYVLLYFIIAFDLWKFPKGALRSIFRVNACLYVFYGLLQLFRVIHTFMWPPSSPKDSSPFSLLMFTIAGISMILLTFNLIIIITTKLNEALHNEINAKNNLYAIISHDLRGPINNFMNYTSVLKESFDKWDPIKTRQWIGEMEKSSDASRFLMENLLYWSRDQLKEIQVNIKPANLTALIHQSVKILQSTANAKSIQLSFGTHTPLFIETDENIMQIILRNIISNAIKYTPEGGEVTITIQEKSKNLDIIISDNGIGISATDLVKIMDKNQALFSVGTSNEKGSGFGLKLCGDLIRLLKGKMKIESSVDVGTVITLSLAK